MRVLAIDVGLTGALAIQDTGFDTVEVFDMPVIKIKAKRKGKEINRTIVDIKGLLDLLAKVKANKCLLEKQEPRLFRWSFANS